MGEGKDLLPKNDLYLSLQDENIGIETEIPTDVVPLEPIENWDSRKLLYGQLDNWLTSISFHLDDRYKQFTEIPSTRFVSGMTNPSNILYSLTKGQLYIPYDKMTSEPVSFSPTKFTRGINPKFSEELALISSCLLKYGELRVKEGVEIPYWGEVPVRILNRFAKYSNFVHDSILIHPLDAKRATDALITLSKNLYMFKALDQK